MAPTVQAFTHSFTKRIHSYKRKMFHNACGVRINENSSSYKCLHVFWAVHRIYSQIHIILQTHVQNHQFSHASVYIHLVRKISIKLRKHKKILATNGKLQRSFQTRSVMHEETWIFIPCSKSPTKPQLYQINGN